MKQNTDTGVGGIRFETWILPNPHAKYRNNHGSSHDAKRRLASVQKSTAAVTTARVLGGKWGYLSE